MNSLHLQSVMFIDFGSVVYDKTHCNRITVIGSGHGGQIYGFIMLNTKNTYDIQFTETLDDSENE